MPSWAAPELASILEDHVAPNWWDLGHDDPRWANVEAISDDELWTGHTTLHGRLVDVIRSQGKEGSNPDA